MRIPLYVTPLCACSSVGGRPQRRGRNDHVICSRGRERESEIKDVRMQQKRARRRLFLLLPYTHSLFLRFDQNKTCNKGKLTRMQIPTARVGAQGYSFDQIGAEDGIRQIRDCFKKTNILMVFPK